MSARDHAIAERLEELRTRLFRADDIVSTAARAARSDDPFSHGDAEMLYQALCAVSEIIDGVAGKMEAGPFLREADEVASAAAADRVEIARREALDAPVCGDEEAKAETRRH